MHYFSTIASSIVVAAGCVFLGSAPASAAVVASASMNVSVTVVPSCTGACAANAGTGHTEHFVTVDRDAADSAGNPAPASPTVQRMLVVSY